MHELPDLSRLRVAEKDALILAQVKQVARLMATVQVLSARARELDAIGIVARG